MAKLALGPGINSAFLVERAGLWKSQHLFSRKMLLNETMSCKSPSSCGQDLAVEAKDLSLILEINSGGSADFCA